MVNMVGAHNGEVVIGDTLVILNTQWECIIPANIIMIITDIGVCLDILAITMTIMDIKDTDIMVIPMVPMVILGIPVSQVIMLIVVQMTAKRIASLLDHNTGMHICLALTDSADLTDNAGITEVITAMDTTMITMKEN